MIFHDELNIATGRMVTKMQSIVQDTSILPPDTCPPHHNIATIQTRENNWPTARTCHHHCSKQGS